jgi:uncharacterized protein (TIGR02118 family)
MIRLSVFYPVTEGASFDHDSYGDKHVPLAVRTWGLESAQIDKGVDGPYVAAVHFTFDSPERAAAGDGRRGHGRRALRRRQLHLHRSRPTDQ